MTLFTLKLFSKGNDFFKKKFIFLKRAGNQMKNDNPVLHAKERISVGQLTVIDIAAGFSFFWLQISVA